jgi:hypothetical protein
MSPSILLLSVYFSGRLFFYDAALILNGRKAGYASLLYRNLWGLLAALLLAPRLSTALFIFAFHLLLTFFDSLVKNSRQKRGGWYYALHLAVVVLLTPPLINWLDGLWRGTQNPLSLFYWYFSLADPLKANRVLLLLSGYVVTLKEGTIFIRLILNRLRALPRKSPDEKRKDQREYELGRIIGLLERTFLYFLIIWNQIGAIAILIALKSLARFKELDDKNFAEYFLVGSLLSLFAAALPAIVVRLLLN